MYDDVLGITAAGTGGTGAVLAATGAHVGSLLMLAWGLALIGVILLALGSRVAARRARD
jgi:uncharacterized membrane protein